MSIPMPSSLRLVAPSARKLSVSAPRLYLFAGYGLRHSSGKRELQTSTAFRPHTLPDGMFPFRGDLSNVAAQEVTSSAPDPSSSLSSLFANASASGAKEKKKSMDMQKRDVLPNSTSTSSTPSQSESLSSSPASSSVSPSSAKQTQRPRRKLRPRKAAISLTPSAVSHIRGLLEGPNPRLIRIGVKNRGCSGLAYMLDYVEKPGPFDEIVEQDGVKVLIDSKALFSIIGSEMDWEDKKLSSKFVFKNPNISE
ncbi:hypothetical protein KEM56_000675 [Ascosphaera pollenicola]|nr:hypothetical protein KEM56_000675 [Ascosphaera pollenicola]